ncbi:MAG: tetratricopeptide repeat protein [Fibrobacter sp.]|nr:tetratricopeptide repeat protein [Fibrobacter sp.]
MKKQFLKNFIPATVLTCTLGLVSCNIFNPTEDVNIKSDDAAALTYEGYLHYQKNEYTLAREYFEKAIAADSSYSEAWYGRAKAALNMQPGLNIFELLSYAKNDGGENNAMTTFSNMDEEEAKLLAKGIDSVFYFLDPFVKREREGKTDGHVKFSQFSGSYSILKMAQSGLMLRGSMMDISNLLIFDGQNISVNVNAIIESVENFTEVMDVADELIDALVENPDLAYNVLESVYPEVAENFTSTGIVNALKLAQGGMEATNSTMKQFGAERAAVFVAGNSMDDDGDGCVDEEVMDGYDNDGDGEIDEDSRPTENVDRYDAEALLAYYDNDPVAFEYFYGHPYDNVYEVKFTEATKYVDTDGNGAPSYLDPAEWTFIYDEQKVRYSKNDYRFQFAENLKWVPAPEDKDIYFYKEKLRKDPFNPDYNLKWRQEHIGGCWNNYHSESDPSYIQWFVGRE